jgi:hypothetical protein
MPSHPWREIRDATNGNYALDSKRFQAQVAATVGQRAYQLVIG